MGITHKELVKIAVKWAMGRHNVVISERGAINEIPDVVGLHYAYTTLIECKASRADFQRDKFKITRRHSDICIGNYRIYCAPHGLLSEDDIPETWGLLEVYPSGHVKLRTNIYKHRAGAIWWHDYNVEGLKAERHLILNHFLYPRNYPLDKED